jgi:ABC-type polysaccharide/polyol phosphate export permease
MGTYLAAIWRCRYFWLSLVKNDLRTRYRRSMLGMGWSLLNPICMTIILCVVFHTIFHADIRTFGPRVLAGMACWNFVLTATVMGCKSFFDGENYIRQYPAPLAIYPLRTALGAGIHFLCALAVVLALAWTVLGFANPFALLWLIPNLLLLFVFAWSLAVLGGFANVYFQDTQHLTEVGFQILFYVTPIIYPEEVAHSPRLWTMLRLNPLTHFLQLVRDPILAGRVSELKHYFAAGLTTLIALGLATLVLHRCQRRLIFQL